MDSKYMDKKRKNLIQLIMKANITKNEGKCLLYIADKGDVKTRELEDSLDLRQPEVSIAVQNLRKKGWIEKGEVKKKGKGRPSHVYKLKKPIEDIMNDVIKEIEKKIKELKDGKRKVRDLTIELFY